MEKDPLDGLQYWSAGPITAIHSDLHMRQALPGEIEPAEDVPRMFRAEPKKVEPEGVFTIPSEAVVTSYFRAF